MNRLSDNQLSRCKSMYSGNNANMETPGLGLSNVHNGHYSLKTNNLQAAEDVGILIARDRSPSVTISSSSTVVADMMPQLQLKT